MKCLPAMSPTNPGEFICQFCKKPMAEDEVRECEGYPRTDAATVGQWADVPSCCGERSSSVPDHSV